MSSNRGLNEHLSGPYAAYVGSSEAASEAPSEAPQKRWWNLAGVEYVTYTILAMWGIFCVTLNYFLWVFRAAIEKLGLAPASWDPENKKLQYKGLIRDHRTVGGPHGIPQREPDGDPVPMERRPDPVQSARPPDKD